MPEALVVDASALVDLLLDTTKGYAVAVRLQHSTVHTPAHADAEVLSAFGRLYRAGDLDARIARRELASLAGRPIVRHPVGDLLGSAWALRENVRLADALYVALAEQLNATLVTTDARLARASGAELVG
ncbi:MAG: type II toxin-antitoxin system VapC family toxin [Acidimicrobiia bacterium]